MSNKCQYSEALVKKIYLKIGQNVKRYRQEKGMSQLALALALGHKSVGIVSTAETGLNNKHFNLEHLIKISCILERDVADFFDGVADLTAQQ